MQVFRALNDLISNYALICAGSAWVAAQILKIFTGIFRLREFSISAMLFGTGGMPSSHTASVCSLATACALRYGLGSGYFAVAFLLCIIVMTDATGVRLETGKQAKVLNRILRDLFSHEHRGEVGENLKELVGHTPLQVFVGALLGVAVPFLMALIPAYRGYLPL